MDCVRPGVGNRVVGRFDNGRVQPENSGDIERTCLKCHAASWLMLYQMPAVSAASIRQRKTGCQYSNGNRMPPSTKASPKPTSSLPAKRNIRLTRQVSSCELLDCDSDGALGAKLPTIMKRSRGYVAAFILNAC